MKGVIVYADGRASAFDHCTGASWYIQANPLDGGRRRYFLLADIARNKHVPTKKRRVYVYTERPEADYLARPR